jgi:transposase
LAETVPQEEGQIGFITSVVTQRASESDDPGLEVTLAKQEHMGLERPSEMYRTSPDLADTGTQSKMNATVKKSKMARRYGEEFKRQAVELMIHSGKTQRQVARELDVSEYSLNLWKKAYLGEQAPAEINGEMKSPEEMAEIIRQQHKEIEYLKRQREILKKAMSIVGEEPSPGMR